MNKREAEVVAEIVATLESDGNAILPEDMAILKKSKVFTAAFDKWALFFRREREHRRKFNKLMEKEFGLGWVLFKDMDDNISRVWEEAEEEE